MEHKTTTFTFENTAGKEVEIHSRKYTFDTEDVLVKTFGKEAINKHKTTGKMEAEFTLKDVKEDFPKLLDLGNQKIDWSKQDYDEILRVYLFFIRYKKNAQMRQYILDSETIASLLGQMKTHLSSIRGHISQSKKEEITKSQ